VSLRERLLENWNMLGKISSGRRLCKVLLEFSDILYELYDRISVLEIKNLLSKHGISIYGHRSSAVTLRGALCDYNVTLLINYSRKTIYLAVSRGDRVHFSISLTNGTCTRVMLDHAGVHVSQIMPKKAELRNILIRFDREFYFCFYGLLRKIIAEVLARL